VRARRYQGVGYRRSRRRRRSLGRVSWHARRMAVDALCESDSHMDGIIAVVRAERLRPGSWGDQGRRRTRMRDCVRDGAWSRARTAEKRSKERRREVSGGRSCDGRRCNGEMRKDLSLETAPLERLIGDERDTRRRPGRKFLSRLPCRPTI
jgi:hypothetical protein